MSTSMNIVRISEKKSDGFVDHLPCGVKWEANSAFYKEFNARVSMDGFIDGPDDVQYMTDSYSRPEDFNQARAIVVWWNFGTIEESRDLLGALYEMEKDPQIYFTMSF